MSTRSAPERANQRYRTRKDLIAAAARLMKNGRKPSLEEVAEAALVSRATAYRYFPNIEALLVEATVDIAVPNGEAVFADDPSEDMEERVDRAEAAMHRIVFGNEAAIRLILAASLTRAAAGPVDEAMPLRQNRRTPLIEAALAPARRRLRKDSYDRLRAALAMIFGSESMIVFRDVLRLDETVAREVKSWAVRALVRAALEESQPARPAGERVSETTANSRKGSRLGDRSKGGSPAIERSPGG
ncbi:TetR/AcrR family transcriptional regulator [Inquilinus limosus]|uniref:TetR/AcrR family transcriptional regulator n=1 Tax=Inquilinus limosus TaxID=171674 RepID=UPI003F1444AF